MSDYRMVSHDAARSSPSLTERAQDWCQTCGACDAGLSMACTHPDEDPRLIISALHDALDQVVTERDALAARVAAVEALHYEVAWDKAIFASCGTCPQDWPCETAKALAPATPAAGGGA